MKKLFTLIATLLMTLSMSAQHGEYVGGDISLLPAYEEHNSNGYLDGNGKKISNLLTWFMTDCGWNSFRVRLFVNPTNADHDGVIQDLDYVKKLGKRIKDAGANFMLDFHYSDTWVDATHIQAPAVCSGMTTDQKAEWIYNYTKESLEALKAYGAQPDLVQVGNEIMYGFMGIKVHPYNDSSDDWTGFLKVLTQGCKAVRDVCPQAKIIIHTDRPTNSDYNKIFYQKLDAASVPYDIIGLSFYPFWHGWLTAHTDKYNNGLTAALNKLATTFPEKKVQIVETGYYYYPDYWPSSGVNYDTRDTWASTADGQYKFIKDLIADLANHSNVNGLFYWFPEEAGCGDDTNWSPSVNPNKYGTVVTSPTNRGLWWSTNNGGHWPVKAADGMVSYLMKNFLDPNLSGINEVSVNSGSSNKAWYNLSGQRVAKPSQSGIYVNGGRKVLVK